MTSENDQHREKRLPDVIPPLSNTWWAPWTPEEPLRAKFPKRGTDYRDSLPDDFQTVVNSYAPYIKPHRWTFGLLDMWSPKAKLVKHSVHVSVATNNADG
jgi:hypothetical protein